jgi:hypothetical protein
MLVCWRRECARALVALSRSAFAAELGQLGVSLLVQRARLPTSILTHCFLYLRACVLHSRSLDQRVAALEGSRCSSPRVTRGPDAVTTAVRAVTASSGGSGDGDSSGVSGGDRAKAGGGDGSDSGSSGAESSGSSGASGGGSGGGGSGGGGSGSEEESLEARVGALERAVIDSTIDAASAYQVTPATPAAVTHPAAPWRTAVSCW